MKLYIAGPMTGIPEFNFPAFHATAKAWRDAGWDVINPAEMDGGYSGGEWLDYLARDLPVLMRCQAICLLPGWEHSRGARLEMMVAGYLGHLVLDAAQVIDPPVS
jgi:hypothetical protein